MSLHGDLLQQARRLATLEPRCPKQASLRRAISTAYYALFHLLVSEASGLMITGTRRTELRNALRRAFAHAEMKEVARGFLSGNISQKIAPALNGLSLQSELVAVADAFVRLQQARHEADYEAGRTFTRQDALGHVDLAETAFENRELIRGSLQADVFLTALLIQRQMRH